MHVYLLWHIREENDGEEDGKLIGVFATAEDAEGARQRAATRPGFRDSPEGFVVDRYTIGQDHWAEGFGTDTHANSLGKLDGDPELERDKPAKRSPQTSRVILPMESPQ